jgi:hypothetical protein
LIGERSRTNRLERLDEMGVHEKMQGGLNFLLGLALFLNLSLHFKISETHLKFGSMVNYLWDELN